MSIEERDGAGRPLINDDLSPTEKPVKLLDDAVLRATASDPTETTLNMVREKEGTIRALRQRIASQDKSIKELEDSLSALESSSVNRGILLGRAVCYIQPGRDALDKDSRLRVEVSGLLDEILRELDKDPEAFTGRLSSDQAKKFVEVASRKDVLAEDVRRMCLTCGAEIPEDEMACPACYEAGTERETLVSTVGSDVHDRIQELWEKAQSVDEMKDRIRELEAVITKLEGHQSVLQDHVDGDSYITEVKVAGRLLGRLNSMVTVMDSSMREAQGIAALLTKELEESKAERATIQQAVAKVIQQKITESMTDALQPFISKEED